MGVSTNMPNYGMKKLLIALFAAALLFTATATAQTATSYQFLPLAFNAPQTRYMPPNEPVPLPMPPGTAPIVHTLSSFVIGQHPVSENVYYLVLAKFAGGNQDALVLRMRPGASTTELVYTIDGKSAQFPGPIALGSGVLTRSGGMILSFSACDDIDPAPPSTGCRAYYYELSNIDLPFASTQSWQELQRIEGVK